MKGLFAGVLVLLLLVSGCVDEGEKEVTTTLVEVTTTVIATTTTLPAGPASDNLVFKRVVPEDAVDALLAGEIDYYLGSLTSQQVSDLKSNPDVTLYYASSQINGVLLNPAPAPEGGLNPFSLQEVRFAVQYLLDRNKIVDDVHNGFGAPINVNIVPSHPSYVFIQDVIEGYDITYDSGKADAMITEAMEDAGALKVDEIWTYDGRNVTLIVYIRSDNPVFKGIGELFSSELEDAGFKVERVYHERGDETPVYDSDPAELKWNVGFVGWIYYGHSEYEGVSFPEVYHKTGWWSYNNSEMSIVEDKLLNYSSEIEWKQLNQELAALGIEDSVGIWVTSSNNVFAARNIVQGLTNDTFIGLRSYGNIREAHVPGDDTLTVGNEYLYVESDSWNPVVIEGISMMDIVNTIQDPITWENPLTLETQPFRADYSIDLSVQDVPGDAFTWDSTSKTWMPVGEGVEAKSKVTYDLSKLIDAKWHHGVSITWADVLYTIASYWDMGYDSEKEEMSSSRWTDKFEPVVGLKIVGNKLEVYLDQWSFIDDELLVMDSVLLRSAPWELFTAMDKTVYTDKKLVYDSYNKPDDLNVSAISLVNTSHVEIVLTALDALEYSEVASYMTVSGTEYASVEELNERTIALNDWNTRHNHLVLGYGPFYIEEYSYLDGSIKLKAFRDPTYPFKEGDWQV